MISLSASGETPIEVCTLPTSVVYNYVLYRVRGPKKTRSTRASFTPRWVLDPDVRCVARFGAGVDACARCAAASLPAGAAATCDGMSDINHNYSQALGRTKVVTAIRVRYKSCAVLNGLVQASPPFGLAVSRRTNA